MRASVRKVQNSPPRTVSNLRQNSASIIWIYLRSYASIASFYCSTLLRVNLRDDLASLDETERAYFFRSPNTSSRIIGHKTNIHKKFQVQVNCYISNVLYVETCVEMVLRLVSVWNIFRCELTELGSVSFSGKSIREYDTCDVIFVIAIQPRNLRLTLNWNLF